MKSEDGLVLAGARILRRDGSVEDPADVVIRSGVVERVIPRPGPEDSGRAVSPSPGVDLAADGRACTGASLPVVDCTGCYVSPGLVNLHTHSPMVLFRGMAEDISIDDWFNVCIFPYESRLTAQDVRVGALLAINEMVDSGVTAFFDHYFMAEEIVNAALETGIRADIAPTVFGSAEWEGALRVSLALMEAVNNEDSLVRVRLGPHAPYTCPPEVLEACAREAQRTGSGIHIHVSETRQQVEDSLRRYGKTPFRVLYDAGLMDAQCILAHGTWMLPEEVPLVEGPSFLAVAPKTYLKLSSGAGNLYEVLKHLRYPGGLLRVGIGTDGAASSNTLSPLEQARIFALLGKDRWGDATAFDLRTVWQTLMAGHDALGRNTGDVAAGYVADFVVWDLKQPQTWPLADAPGPSADAWGPLAAILYSGDARNVRDVLVAGRFLKRAGKVVAVDTAGVLSSALSVRSRLVGEGVGKARVRY